MYDFTFNDKRFGYENKRFSQMGAIAYLKRLRRVTNRPKLAAAADLLEDRNFHAEAEEVRMILDGEKNRKNLFVHLL